MHLIPHTEVTIPHQLHVLVVEDETVARSALQALLSSHGFDTTAVASGEEALRAVSDAGDPFVVLIDLDLPGMSGADLARELRKRRPDSKAIVVTAASPERVRELFGEQTPHLRKPLDFSDLLAMLSDPGRTDA